VTSQNFLDFYSKESNFKTLVDGLSRLAKARLSFQNIMAEPFKKGEKINDIDIEDVRMILVNSFPFVDIDISERARVLVKEYTDKQLKEA